MFLETCVDQLLRSSRTPIVFIFVYFPLVFINLGNYVGIVRFEETKYGKPYLDSYLAFVVLSTASFILPAAINWVWAARFCHDGKQRENKLLFGLLIMFVFHDCPFFFMEMIAILNMNSPDKYDRTTFENFNFAMSIVAFSISFIPAWLYWAKIASECVETRLCRQPGEKFSFERESMMEVASEVMDNDAMVAAWRRRILMLYATPNSRHGSMSPSAMRNGNGSSPPSAAAVAGRNSNINSNNKRASHENDDDDVMGANGGEGSNKRNSDKDRGGEDLFSTAITSPSSARKKASLRNKKKSQEAENLNSIIAMPKELLAFSSAKKKKKKTKTIFTKKTIKKKDDDGNEVEEEVDEEIQVTDNDNDDDSSSSDQDRHDVNEGPKSPTAEGGLEPLASSTAARSASQYYNDQTPEIIVDSLLSPSSTKNKKSVQWKTANQSGGARSANHNNFNNDINSSAYKNNHHYDAENVLSPPMLHVKKDLFNNTNTTSADFSGAAMIMPSSPRNSAAIKAMRDPTSPTALAHMKNDDDDAWGVPRRTPQKNEKGDDRKSDDKEVDGDDDDRNDNKKNANRKSHNNKKQKKEEGKADDEKDDDDDDPFRRG